MSNKPRAVMATVVELHCSGCGLLLGYERNRQQAREVFEQHLAESPRHAV